MVGFIGGIVHGYTRRVHDPRLRWHKNLLTLVTHQTGKLIGIGSLAWAGHLVHVALPGSRGIRIGWLQLLTFLPSPHGLLPLLTGNWALYAEHPDRMPHIFGRLDPATGSAILTFTGTYAPRSGSLWLSDVSHHHLALGIVALLLSHMLSVASLPRMPISSVHFDLAVGLAALGTLPELHLGCGRLGFGWLEAIPRRLSPYVGALKVVCSPSLATGVPEWMPFICEWNSMYAHLPWVLGTNCTLFAGPIPLSHRW